jgi:4-hydroxybenzoate polyprenyltransferase
MSKLPLIVDLDGTLIFSDTLHELIIVGLRKNLFYLFIFPILLLRGRASFKKFLSSRFQFEITSMPYHQAFISWLYEQKLAGRKLILCTGADAIVAQQFAKHLDLFSEVYSSNGIVNLTGVTKSRFLIKKFGDRGFDYAGNSSDDLHVWKVANNGILVNASPRVSSKATEICQIENKFISSRSTIKELIRSLRLHQWLKNFLLFVPFFAAHQSIDAHIFVTLFLSFCSFGLCASSVYILNDIVDLESDRKHPSKSGRPFAAGSISILNGLFMLPLLITVGLYLASYVNNNFLYWLIFYFGLTCLYTFSLKKIIIIDCLTLAMLYTIRIISGTEALDLPISFWLLAFSVFLFLSLAFVKRYTELNLNFLDSGKKAYGRGYYQTDASLIQYMGITSGYSSVLVLSLYLNSDAVQRLYKFPEVVWGAVPIMLFWVSWMWINAHRGRMHDDPLIFAVKDPISQLAGLIFLLVMLVGSFGISS